MGPRNPSHSLKGRGLLLHKSPSLSRPERRATASHLVDLLLTCVLWRLVALCPLALSVASSASCPALCAAASASSAAARAAAADALAVMAATLAVMAASWAVSNPSAAVFSVRDAPAALACGADSQNMYREHHIRSVKSAMVGCMSSLSRKSREGDSVTMCQPFLAIHFSLLSEWLWLTCCACRTARAAAT